MRPTNDDFNPLSEEELRRQQEDEEFRRRVRDEVRRVQSGEAEEDLERDREEERAERAQAAPKTIGDVFASMMSRPGAAAAVNRMAMPHAPSPTVGRNDPCPCGSGKKYKKCCGRNLV